MLRDSCLVCNTINIRKIIDLGLHSYADTFIPKVALNKTDPVYPLICYLCINCGHIQSGYATDPNERYSLYDYSYTSSNSATSRSHWFEYAECVCKKIDIDSNELIVEIGSNDGFLAKCFQEKGQRVLGIDASKKMAEIAMDCDVQTIVGLFDEKISNLILSQHGAPKIIIANNVFNHSNDPVEFATIVSNLLSPNGTFIFELPYWINAFISKRYDQIYHEHVSYFTIKSAVMILKKANMKIVDLQMVDYHGGSIRVYAKKTNSKPLIKIEDFINKETQLGVFDYKTYPELMKLWSKQKIYIFEKVCEIKSRNGHVIAVGAAAKGNTFLTFCGFNNSLIEYVTDTSKYKQGKYTPLTRIPICGDKVFSQYNNPYALMLSWNLSNQIKLILQKINKSIIFLELEL